MLLSWAIRASRPGLSPPMPCAASQSALLQASQQSIISHLISPTAAAACRLQVSYHYLLMKDCSASCRCLSHCQVVVSAFSSPLLSLSHIYFSLPPSLHPSLLRSLPNHKRSPKIKGLIQRHCFKAINCCSG